MRFPSAVNPEILLGMATSSVLDGFGVSGGNPEGGVVLVFPLMGVDNFFDRKFVFESALTGKPGS